MSESDVYRRQILTCKVGPSAGKVYLLIGHQLFLNQDWILFYKPILLIIGLRCNKLHHVQIDSVILNCNILDFSCKLYIF